MVPENVLKHAPWSYSKANTAISCPLAFNLSYVDHKPKIEAETKITEIGTVVHKILELVSLGATVSRSFARALEMYELINAVKMDVKTYREAIEAFAKGLIVFDKIHGIQRRLVESEFAIDKDFKAVGWFDKKVLLRGKIDLVLITKEKAKRAVTIDHKSGAVQDMEHHKDQLECYAVLLDAVIPELTAIQSGIHSVAADPKADGTRTRWTEQFAITHVRSEFRKNVINFLTRAANSAETRTPCKGWMCGFCGYKPICLEHKRH